MTRAIILILILTFVGGAYIWFRETQVPSQVHNNTSFHFEIVDTPAAREQGLGGRSDIPEDYGMLFVFPKSDRYGIWMKDMLLSIDIIWLREDGTVISVDASVSPDTYPQAFYPPEPVRYVLETRAGEAARKGWTSGSRIALPK